MDVRWRALAILTLARTSVGFQFQSLASVSAGVMPDLALSYADLGVLVALYFLPGVVVSLPAGAAARRQGDTRMVLAGLATMTAGGLLTAAAGSEFTLGAGRALSGVGAVVLNVVMSKMVTDWFAGRELPLAMSIFINSFPVGIGAALFVLGALASVVAWATSLLVASTLPALALVLVLFAYPPHPNDRPACADTPAARPLAWRATGLLCVAGAMWGLLNGAVATMATFFPAHLVRDGLSPENAAAVLAACTWAVVLSVQLGGLLAQTGMRPAALFGVGCVGWALCSFAAAGAPGWAAPAVILSGLVLGLPIGVILSLPSQVLQPEQRAVGMGIFYVWLYLGHGAVPVFAGWLQHQRASTSVPLVITGGLALVILLLYGVFRLFASGANRLPAASAARS